MIYKKSVVLNALDNSLKKAVVNLDSKAGVVKGDVRLYNFIEEPMGVLTLGLLVDGKVHKAGLTRTGYMQYNFGSILSKIPGACTCAIISSKSGTAEPLLLGSIESSHKDLEDVLLQNLSVLEKNKVNEIKQVVEENIGQYEDEKEIEEKIDECLKSSCEHNCLNCEYKKVFYEEENKQGEEEKIPYDLKNEIIKGKLRVPTEEKNFNFFDEIGGQIKGLFDTFPRENELEEIIPNSKWVKIDFNKDGKYYVVGLIYENDEIKYVCYGVPGEWSENPPENFNENASWLALDLDEPRGKGYWITYQDALDGNLIAVNVI